MEINCSRETRQGDNSYKGFQDTIRKTRIKLRGEFKIFKMENLDDKN
jgi:hypothetical protein